MIFECKEIDSGTIALEGRHRDPTMIALFVIVMKIIYVSMVPGEPYQFGKNRVVDMVINDMYCQSKVHGIPSIYFTFHCRWISSILSFILSYDGRKLPQWSLHVGKDKEGRLRGRSFPLVINTILSITVYPSVSWLLFNQEASLKLSLSKRPETQHLRRCYVYEYCKLTRERKKFLLVRYPKVRCLNCEIGYLMVNPNNLKQTGRAASTRILLTPYT